ncbi:MAG: phosphoribosylformylglycinamidine synthase subunit PurQ, partial [Bauldia sp.]
MPHILPTAVAILLTASTLQKTAAASHDWLGAPIILAGFSCDSPLRIIYACRMKSAVVVFPGSNRERDMIAALEKITGRRPAIVWHADTDLPAADLIVLPGGFSYGDYLRSGAIAARAPIMRAVAERAAKGVPVLG